MNVLNARVGTFVAASLAAFVGLAVAGAPDARADEGDCRVIVGFKTQADPALVTRLGGDLGAVRGRIAVCRIPASRIAALRAEEAVDYVEEDVLVEANISVTIGGSKPPPPPPAQTVPWGVQKVWNSTYAPAVTGSDVKVAIIDTGIDLTHADLSANVAGSKNFVRSVSSANDDNGHGTHVAGSVGAVDDTKGVVGVAPKARLYAVKVLDRRGSGYLSDVAAGIDWAAANGMNVANMSLGTSSDSATLRTACANAENGGVLLVAAAGNSGDGSTSTVETGYPAAYASVVAVGATDSSDRLASWSNTGSYVEVSAPGASVYSTYKGGGYATLSGTSMASPHAAGMAALLWSEQAASSSSPTNATVRSALQTRVRDLGAAGRDYGFGYGCVYFPQ